MGNTPSDGSAEGLFDHSADVVVVGSGAAGYAAALTAANEGASVIILERADYPGGTTLLSGGTSWIPNNSLMRANGIEDPREDALRFLCRLAYPQRYDPKDPTLGLGQLEYRLIATFFDEAGNAIDYLSEIGALEPYFDGTITDYHAHLPEDAAPRGRRVPQRGGSEAMFERMGKVGESLGVNVLLEHRVLEVLRNDAGEVFGVEARSGVRTVLVRARKAVVFATGGYIHDEELVRRYLPGRVYGSCATPGATGDFLRIGQGLGAQLGNMGRAWWNQAPLEAAIRSRHTTGLFYCPGDSMIQVNRSGVRVVNEKAPYNERGQIHSYWDAASRSFTNQVLFMIWDDKVHRDEARNPTLLGGADDVIVAPDFEQLTDRISERLAGLAAHTGGLRLEPDFASNLARTVDRFGQFAWEGIDHDFHRGESPMEITYITVEGPPPRPGMTSPVLAPFDEEGPYYCLLVGAGALDTNGGPRTNERAQVIDPYDRPIPGLYGAGNCVASITGNAYWGPGGTIGPATCYGYLAGLNAAKEPEKKVAE